MQNNEVGYIQPTAQRQIEHMQTNVASYPTIQRPIEQTTNKSIELMQNNEVGYIQPIVQRQIEQTINKPIEFNQAASLAYNPSIPQRHIVHTQNQPFDQPITQNQTTDKVPNDPTQVATVVNQPRSYNRPIGYEEKSYLCSWCETPTKFKDRTKLSKHIKRFHAAFHQKNKGTKRGNDDLDEITPKRHRGNDDDDNLYRYDDDDNNENNDNNDNEERNDDDTDEGSDEPQIRFG